MPRPRLEWHLVARNDLLSIVDYISDDNPDAAQKLKDDVEAKVAQLIGCPKIYKAGRVPGTREMVVRQNYIVVFAENDQQITILRVLHGAQLWPR